VRRVCTENDLYIFAHASGSLNPLNLPDRDFDGNPDTPALAPAMWVGALVSQVIGNRLPGPGAEHRAQSFTFHGPVSVGDELLISVRVLEKREPRLIVLETRVALANGDLVADGVAEVFAPLQKRVYDHLSAPDLIVHRHASSERLLAACVGLDADAHGGGHAARRAIPGRRAAGGAGRTDRAGADRRSRLHADARRRTGAFAGRPRDDRGRHAGALRERRPAGSRKTARCVR
jgi:acyl dehydratase